MKSYWS